MMLHCCGLDLAALPATSRHSAGGSTSSPVWVTRPSPWPPPKQH